MKYFFVMTLVLLVMATSMGQEEQDEAVLLFKNQRKSLIKWPEIEPNKWLDFDLWKIHKAQKEKFPRWEQVLRERRNHEVMGRVLDHVGTVHIHRGETSIPPHYRSTLYEGDEIETGRDGHVWIFLMNGALIRLSPTSSLALREINLSSSDVFLFARLNLGHMIWLNRSFELEKKNVKRETDALFLPLRLQAANRPRFDQTIEEGNLFRLIDKEKLVEEHYSALNTKIEKNNRWLSRSNRTLLVLPNANIYSKNMSHELIALTGGKSYFRVWGEGEADLRYRGFENKEKSELKSGQWYVMGERGRVSQEHEGKRLFSLGQFIIKRIPSVKKAREIFLERYSQEVFSANSEEVLAERGYKLWNDIDLPIQGDLKKRIDFLHEYTRRIETTGLQVAKRLREKLQKRGEEWRIPALDQRFFEPSLTAYLVHAKEKNRFDLQARSLNSTRRALWKRIQNERPE